MTIGRGLAATEKPPSAVRAGGRVVELQAPRTLVAEQRSVPEPGPGEALVRIRAVGICGTDVHGYLGRADTWPIVLGHDACAEVMALGPDTTASVPALGSRVTLDPTVSCGGCEHCRAGRRQLCPDGRYLGMTCSGVLAEYLCLPADRLVALPDAVSDTAATVLEPVAEALHLLDRIAGFVPPVRIAQVIGGGPLGVLLAQTLEASGWSCRITEPLADRRAHAEALGLTAVEPAAAERQDRPAGAGSVLVVETSAAAAGIAVARRLATPGSVLALVGRAPADVPSSSILLQELTVLGVRSGSGCYARAVDLVAGGRVRPENLVTHRFPVGDVAHAFAAVTDPQQQVMRSIVDVAEPARSIPFRTPPR